MSQPVYSRVMVEVVAGILPNTPDSKYTKRWTIDSDQWHKLKGPAAQLGALAELAGQAAGYALFLCLQPDQVNWVRTDWLYL